MSKQSSVEYLLDNIAKIIEDDIINKFTIEQTNKMHYLNKQAKAMHKQEIIDAYAQGFIESEMAGKGAEQHYTQTFE